MLLNLKKNISEFVCCSWDRNFFSNDYKLHTIREGEREREREREREMDIKKFLIKKQKNLVNFNVKKELRFWKK